MMNKAQPITVESILKEANLRRTPVRAGVIDVLISAPRPMGAVEILEKLPPHTDAVTVYRTLNTFTEQGIIHRVRSEDRVWRYALGQQDHGGQHHHPHFICEQCGKVECLKEAEIPAALTDDIGVGKKYHVNYTEVVIHGTCPKCQG